MDDIFSPMARAIYRYNNGQKVVNADPLMLRGALTMGAVKRGSTLNALIDSAANVDAENASDMELSDAWKSLCALNDIAMEVFELVPFNKDTGAGATSAHALGVLNHFHLWCEKKNQQPELQPISSPSTESISEIQPTMAT